MGQWRGSERPLAAAAIALTFFGLACAPFIIRNYLLLRQWVWGSTNGPTNSCVVAQTFANRWRRQPNPIPWEPLPPGTTETGMAPILYGRLIRFYGHWDCGSGCLWRVGGFSSFCFLSIPMESTISRSAGCCSSWRQASNPPAGPTPATRCGCPFWHYAPYMWLCSSAIPTGWCFRPSLF